MVCQPPPRPPSRTLHLTLPTNLPARYLTHRVFVVRYNRHNICFPACSQNPPALRLTLPRPAAFDDLDAPTTVHISLRIIGWRWAVVDTHDGTIDFSSLGLNVPGVPGYDPTKDCCGRDRCRQIAMRLADRNGDAENTDGEDLRDNSKRGVRAGVQRAWRGVADTTESAVARSLNWLTDRLDGTHRRRREQEKREDAEMLRVDLNFERFMRDHRFSW